MATHKERVAKVQRFTSSNKMFTIFAVIIVLFLLSNFIFSKVNPKEQPPSEVTSQSEPSGESTTPTEQAPEEAPHWRFYWIDLWVLIGAGGFCSVMIIRQRKKAREELQ